MSASPTTRIVGAIAAPCVLWLICLALAPRAIERDLAQRVTAELESAELGHLAHEVDGRDVVIEVPLTLPGGVEELRRRVAELRGVRTVHTRAIGSLPRARPAALPFSVKDEIREMKGER